MKTKHELADTKWTRTQRHSQMQYLERMSARNGPLTKGEARACENATGPTCLCRCNGWLHGIYSYLDKNLPTGRLPSLADLEDEQQH